MYRTVALDWNPLGEADRALDLALAVGTANASGQRDDTEVREHIAVVRVQRRIVDVGRDPAPLHVAEHDYARYLAQATEASSCGSHQIRELDFHVNNHRALRL